MRRLMPWSWSNHSIFHKLLIAFLIVILPLCALGFTIIQSGVHVVRKEIESSMEAKTHFYLNQLEIEFTKIIDLQSQYINDDDLDKLSNQLPILSALDRTEAIKRLQTRLLLMQNTSTLIKNSSALIPEMDRYVASSDYYGDLDRIEYQALNKPVDLARGPFIYWQDRLFISIATPDNEIVNEISIPNLQKALSQFKIGRSGGAVLVADDSAWFIGSELPPGLKTRLQRFAEDQNRLQRPMGFQTIHLNREAYMVSFERSNSLGCTLITFIPERVLLAPLNRYRVWYWIVSLTSALIVVVFSYWIYRAIHSPLLNLVKGFRRIEMGDLGVQVTYPGKDEFRYLYGQFNSTVSKLHQLIDEVTEQRYQARVAELKHLQSQINPHFLYNCLFNLYRLAKMEENEKVLHFTDCLGRYFQYITRSSDEVALEQEWDFARTYVEIQSIRFGDHIKVDFEEKPPAYRSFKIPKLILQPIIENCYKYALENQQQQGVLAVHLQNEVNQLLITIEDNGNVTDGELENIKQLLQQKDLSNHSGLYNVQRRLQLKYGEMAGLKLGRSHWNGLSVTVVIPLQEEA